MLFIFAVLPELKRTWGIRFFNRPVARTYGFTGRLIDNFHQVGTSHSSLRLRLRFSSQTIFAPKAVVLAAFFNIQGIKTRLIALSQLNAPDQLCLSHSHCLKTFFTRKRPYLLPLHNITSLPCPQCVPKLIIKAKYVPKINPSINQ